MIQPTQQASVAREFGVNWPTPDRVDTPFGDWAQIAALVDVLKGQRLPSSPIIGISGSQGSGKSTLAHIIADRDNELHAVSLDDFYLGRAEREQLAKDVHPLLVTRGVPGTHDHAWLARTLDAAKRGHSYQHPTFDKGKDDRREVVEVDAGTGGLIIEGWCLGVAAQSQQQLAEPCNALEEEEDGHGLWRSWVNEQVATHYTQLWRCIDFWIHLTVPSFAQVHAWRWQQEQMLPASQRMDRQALVRFIQHYERLTEQLWRQPSRGPGLVIKLDEQDSIPELEPIPFR